MSSGKTALPGSRRFPCQKKQKSEATLKFSQGTEYATHGISDTLDNYTVYICMKERSNGVLCPGLANHGFCHAL
jgi:hypothetical protein